MSKEIIIEAATIEQAKAEAAAALGAEESALTFEVLVQPQKKTLGLFGGSPAKVKAVLNETANAAETISGAIEYLKVILEGLGVKNADITVKEQDDRGCVLMLSGENLGVAIGRRGETLDALQYLTGLVANRVQSGYFRVTLDTENFREKREQSLMGLAKKLATQAAKSGRRHSLEPMNPYERRIVHTVVQEVEGAVSWSVGSNSSRHVIIGPSDDNPVRSKSRGKQRGGRPQRSGSGEDYRDNGGERQRPERPQRPARDGTERREDSGRPQRVSRDEIDRPEREVRKFVPRSNPMPAADGGTLPSKTESDVEKSSSLYGRIDL